MRLIHPLRWLHVLPVAFAIACQAQPGQFATLSPTAVLQPTCAAPEKLRTISLSGHAKLDVEPDEANVEMSLRVIDPASPKAATSKLTARREELVKALRKAGLAEEEISISRFTLSPSGEWIGGRWVLREYVTSVQVTAVVRRFERIADVMEVAAGAGVEFINTTFHSTQLTTLKKRVRDMALEAAKEKGEQMAKATGSKILRVSEIKEETAGNWWWRSSSVPNAVGTVGGSASRDPNPQADSLELTVQVVYELG